MTQVKKPIISIDGRVLNTDRRGIFRYLSNLLKVWGKINSPYLFRLYLPANLNAYPWLLSPNFLVKRLKNSHALFWLWRIKKEVERERPALFFSPWSFPLKLAVTQILVLHDLAFFRYPKNFPPFAQLMRAGIALSLKKADHIITNAYFTATEAQAYFHLPASQMSVIHLGVDETFLSPLELGQIRPELRTRQGFLLVVDDLSQHHFTPEIIKAGQALGRRLGQDFILVGENRSFPGLDFEELIQAANEAGGRISWFKEVSEAELAFLYRQAKALIFFSQYEGFGLPVIEAMASGCPVIINKNPTLREVTAGAALEVATPTVEEITKTLRTFLKNPALARRLKAAGRRRARHFSNLKTAERTLEVFGKVIDGSRAVSLEIQQ